MSTTRLQWAVAAVMLAAAAAIAAVHVRRMHPPVCKVCHCGKASCHGECGEENMCALRCEGLCKSKH